MRSFLLLLTLCLSVQCLGQDLSSEQKEPWDALNRQIGLYFERNYEEHDKYIHAKSISWGDDTPSPIHFGERAKKYYQEMFEGQDRVVAHHLVPVSVVVVGDVAIINAYLHTLTKPEGVSEEKIWRLHNTWKKEGDQWQLLATYNTTVSMNNTDRE